MPKKDERSLQERLMERVVVNELTGCWEWQGAKNNIGYGFIRDGNKMRTTHRVSYEEHIANIPQGLCVCHSCDNKKCVNPNHLWLGTVKDNMRDMIKKGRSYFCGIRPKGYKQPQKTCKYCNMSMGINMYGRWHGEKCKHKTAE